MELFKKKSITVWAGINRNGKLSLHTIEPSRNNNLGTWVSNSPFLNSVIYDNLSKTLEKTPMNWQSPSEVFQINL